MSKEVKVALIGAAATIIAAIIGGIFLLRSVSGTATVFPTATASAPASSIITSQTTPAPLRPKNKPFTCTSGSLCLSFPMTIQNTAILINQDNTSTWSFQITNNGSRSLDGYLNVRIGDAGVQYGQLRLIPDEAVLISVTVRFAPSDNAVLAIALVFNDIASGQHFGYSQSCTYFASQNICQS